MSSDDVSDWPQSSPATKTRPTAAWQVPRLELRLKAGSAKTQAVMNNQWNQRVNDTNRYSYYKYGIKKNKTNYQDLLNSQDFDKVTAGQRVIPGDRVSNLRNLHRFQCRCLDTRTPFIDYQLEPRSRDHVLSSMVVNSIQTSASSFLCPTRSSLEKQIDVNVFLLEIYNTEITTNNHNDLTLKSKAVTTTSTVLNACKNHGGMISNICRNDSNEVYADDKDGDEQKGGDDDNYSSTTSTLDHNSQQLAIGKPELLSLWRSPVWPAHMPSKAESKYLRDPEAKPRKRYRLNRQRSLDVTARNDEPLVCIRQLIHRLASRYVATSLYTVSGTGMGNALLPLMVVLAAAACLPSAVDGAKSSTDAFAIGGVFDQGENSHLDEHLSRAVERVNRDGALLRGRELQSISFKTNPGDSFVASKCVCELARQGVVALVGPTSWQVATYVASAAARLHVPHLKTSAGGFRERRSPFSLQLHPAVNQLNKAYYDLIKSRKWKSFAVLYDNDNVFVALKDVLNASLNPPNVLMYPYNPALSFKKMLKDIGSKNIYNIILHLELTKVPQLFREAEEVNQTTLYHDYIVMGLDFHTLDLREFYSLKANVTAFRIIDPDRVAVQLVRRDWALTQGLQPDSGVSASHSKGLGSPGKRGLTGTALFWRKPRDLSSGLPASIDQMSTAEALLYDAVSLVAAGVEALLEKDKEAAKDNKAAKGKDNSKDKDLRAGPLVLSQLDCNRSAHWEHGKALLEAIKGARIRGLSGDLRLNRRTGTRDEFGLDVVELKYTGLKKIASWSPREGLKLNAANRTEQEADLSRTLEGMTLRVVTVLNEPYTMLHPPSENRTGNDRFYGYAIDLIAALASLYKFNYTFYISPDRKYGSRQPDGKWNGMVGELIQRKADIAVVDLTITYEREQVVDFTIPFMNTGISILFKKPEKSEPAIFSFLYPFSIVVWFYTLTVYTFVSILVYVLGRFTPYEWVPSHPCDPQSEPENQFSSLQNAFWFTMGSIMQQGSDLVPRAISTRVLASIWYFFTLILISSYTANLAAFLTAARMGAPIENANDLAKQTKIAYGCLGGGSTYGFFKKHNDPVMKRMWTYMETARPAVFTSSNKEGIERVLRGDYAYLMEALSIEYLVERNCNLTQIGGLLDNKGYGIATPLKSPLRSALTSAILILQEKGVLHSLKMKWWKISKLVSAYDRHYATIASM
ncbi:glutamate receptor ionotropic, kainate 2-like isoform X3 [Varroa destructor]|uniref:Uncharacterized protein n=1 Tax=Varroa destructor TaxID=109461 RepID=A0A7M7K8T0_VARDE|nr:glutamate receptor ionotropic, kainate 2-like isoform X3 [Varroa destructor]